MAERQDYSNWNIHNRTKISITRLLCWVQVASMLQYSIVGYRPTVREHYDAYPNEAKQKIYNSKPGLTGIGSIVFRNEEEILQRFENKKEFHQKVIIPYKAMLESWYVDHKNLFNLSLYLLR
jgi:lipopolysaccharide/colanic/teichoic acid biosynthesis glycosyltransferase